jgi:DNA recombination protein RmuC
MFTTWLASSPDHALLLAAAAGFALGALVAALVASIRLSRARAATLRAEARIAAQDESRRTLLDQFRLLSADTLAAQARDFTLQGRDALAALLAPLDARLADFRRRIDAVHTDDTAQRGALRQQVEALSAQSAAVGAQADRLTHALRGDNKLLGTWGEFSLRRLLEAAGLQENRDFRLQLSLTAPDGRLLQPDAVVFLPEDRCVVIDSKLSLKAYLDVHNADTPDARRRALSRHVAAIEAHIRNLSAKAYQDLPGLPASPDFVLLFVASEPALALAVAEKPDLLELAAHRDVVPVGPGGLLTTLRLVALLWRQSNQNRTTRDIFAAVRAIYDKYAAFAADMQTVSDSLTRASAAYDAAYRKLATGPGNLVRQMERFREENFIRPSKLPPPAYQHNPQPGDNPP